MYCSNYPITLFYEQCAYLDLNNIVLVTTITKLVINTSTVQCS